MCSGRGHGQRCFEEHEVLSIMSRCFSEDPQKFPKGVQLPKTVEKS